MSHERFRVDCFLKIPVNQLVAKYWETIVEKLKSLGWQVRWVEAIQDSEPGWTATAIRKKERHSVHANDLSLAIQELKVSCSGSK